LPMKSRSGRNWIFLGLVGIGAVVAAACVIIILLGLLSLVLPKQACVGVVKVEGTIIAGGSGGSLFGDSYAGSDDIVALIEDANGRSEVKAVVLEVNSGGGSVVGSREIYDSVKSLQKPKVAYFREVAASGGYYVAAGTDYIVSDPDALTGSIGVRATRVDMTELFRMIGYNQTIIGSGDLKGMGDPGTNMSEEERQVLQGIVDEIFQEFRGVVVENRGTKLDSQGFQQVLDARVLTGRQALRIGLVDEVGTRKTALRKAAALANMTYDGDVPPVCSIEKEAGLFDALFSASAQAAAGILVEALRISTGAQGVRLEY